MVERRDLDENEVLRRKDDGDRWDHAWQRVMGDEGDNATERENALANHFIILFQAEELMASNFDRIG